MDLHRMSCVPARQPHARTSIRQHPPASASITYSPASAGIDNDLGDGLHCDTRSCEPPCMRAVLLFQNLEEEQTHGRRSIDHKPGSGSACVPTPFLPDLTSSNARVSHPRLCCWTWFGSALDFCHHDIISASRSIAAHDRWRGNGSSHGPDLHVMFACRPAAAATPRPPSPPSPRPRPRAR